MAGSGRPGRDVFLTLQSPMREECHEVSIARRRSGAAANRKRVYRIVKLNGWQV